MDIPNHVVEKVLPPTPPVTPVPQAPVPPKLPIEIKAEPKVEVPRVTANDILSRTAVKTEATPKEEIKIDEELAKITDPTQRAIVEKKLKDLESGYNQKYQDLARQRKEAEALISQASNWTPQRLAQELKKPEFVQAIKDAQTLYPPQEWEGSADEWSSLNDAEKQQFRQMRQKTENLESQMTKMLQSQEDVEIKKLYPDYNPQVVEEAIDGLRTGKIVANRADIWKVVNHDTNVQKGYDFGYEDGYKKALEKLNGTSITSSNGNMTPSDEVPEEIRAKGFASIAGWRLNRAKNGQTRK